MGTEAFRNLRHSLVPLTTKSNSPDGVCCIEGSVEIIKIAAKIIIAIAGIIIVRALFIFLFSSFPLKY